MKNYNEKCIFTSRSSRNKQWRKRWKDVIKHDYDDDWMYLIEIVLHKLELMRDHFEQNPDLMPLEFEKSSLNEAIGLGTNIISGDTVEWELQDQLDKLNNQHSHFVWYFYIPGDYDEPVYVASEKGETKEVFLSQIDKGLDSYGLKRADLECVAHHEWDKAPEGEKPYVDQQEELFQKMGDITNENVKKFFAVIGDNLPDWWCQWTL